MDIDILKKVCEQIYNNTDVKFGVCESCQIIVIDYYDSGASECKLCKSYFCNDCSKCYKYGKMGCGFCARQKSKW